MLPGKYLLYQQWEGMKFGYCFFADIDEDGTIKIPGARFIGTWTEQAGDIALAIAESSGNSITSYRGRVYGGFMHGDMTGTNKNGEVFKGAWNARYYGFDEAAESELKEPGK